MIGNRRWGALLLTSAFVGAAFFGTVDEAYAKDPTYQFDIPAESLGQALTDFSQISSQQIIYSEDLVRGRRVSGLHGRYSVQEALKALISGTGLKVEIDSSGVLMVRASTDQTSVSDESVAPNDAETIVVTGTHIRGAEVASPVVTITQQQIRQGGFNNLGEVARSIPENFSGGQNPGVGAGGGSITNQNISSGSAFNLRGLGPGATLTLLNGQRMSYEGPFEAVDISAIPVAAIDRVEVLLDGASAVYGSDAVAGVANVMLRRDYDGVGLSARVGTATDGGYEQSDFSAVGGKVWQSGGLLIAGDILHNTAISASQRDFLDTIPESTQIYPSITQKSVVLTGHQKIGPSTTFSIDALFSDRDARQELVSTYDVIQLTGARAWHIAPRLAIDISKDWQLNLNADFNRDTTNYKNDYYSLTTGERTLFYQEQSVNDSQAVGVDAEGSLFKLPGGEVRTSFGIGWRRGNLREVVAGSQPGDVSGHNTSYSAYVETRLPFIAEAQHIPFVSCLSIDGAVRYEHYDNFGETVTPKLGVIWGLVPGLEVKASWGRSFKAPALLQQYQASVLYYLPSASFGGAPAGRTIMLQWGGNRDLKPERAKTFTAGFGITPDMVPGLALDLSWSDVRYTDRAVQAVSDYTAALVDPAAQQFVTNAPTTAEQDAAFAAAGSPVGSFFLNEGNPDYSPRPYDPSEVYAIVDNRYINAAADHVSTIDLSGRYVSRFLGGHLTINGNAAWFLKGTRKVTSLAPKTAITGVVFFAPKFRGRMAASWSQRGLTISSAVNQIGGVTNNLVTPATDGSSMTTIDLVGNYDFGAGILRGVSLNLAFSNIFDVSPPYMKALTVYRPTYDSTNYSGIGRTVNLTISMTL
ncbi:TonB-dependent receptor [Hephaestia mangrovi]|uniref:TonB-dependent receptor n=1 Tax=Hephaestia mangrovi TaxID=2873268 RepID=UPI001CA781ED|nr:TonB-dependent receptor [Hephaestia mangrovi]MBY8829155.1 TonB-dependent receptor [Hephaestia mangrovi]